MPRCPTLVLLLVGLQSATGTRQCNGLDKTTRSSVALLSPALLRHRPLTLLLTPALNQGRRDESRTREAARCVEWVSIVVLLRHVPTTDNLVWHCACCHHLVSACSASLADLSRMTYDILAGREQRVLIAMRGCASACAEVHGGAVADIPSASKVVNGPRPSVPRSSLALALQISRATQPAQCAVAGTIHATCHLPSAFRVPTVAFVVYDARTSDTLRLLSLWWLCL